jgi:predicted nuclease of restriction endonuclease-like (RecB) superfamily
MHDAEKSAPPFQGLKGQDMSLQNFTSDEYKVFIQDIKQRIQAAQIKAAVTVNREMLSLYWDLGLSIIEKQKLSAWGDGFIKQMSKDLQEEFPEMKGFSERNLKYMRQWVQFWSGHAALASGAEHEFGQQLVAQITQIPWGQNLMVLGKARSHDEALFYVQKTMENNWSRSVLLHQIEGQLFERTGKAIDNFKATLPTPHSDLARETIKNPYTFDFLTIREKHDEKELEDALVQHITQFLLELGAGFAYLGKQYKLEVEGDTFFIDLLFYHTRLHCYVVVELKTVKFQPEFAGKLNFYVSAVDSQVKSPEDNPTLGILICKSKKNTVVEYALRDIQKPIGVSEYTLTQALPESFKSSLPSIAEIEAELESYEI